MLTIAVTHEPPVDEWSAAIMRGVENAMPAIAEVLREAADRCFDTETDPWGEAWAPLAPATIAQRAREGTSGKILNRRGFLRGSIAGSPTSPTPGVMRAVVAPGGAAAAYAAVHQFGDATVPARPYLPIRPGDVVDLPEDLHAEIVETLRDSIRIEIARTRRP